MRYERYIGQIGLLTAVLGIGLTAPAVATAAPEDDTAADSRADGSRPTQSSPDAPRARAAQSSARTPAARTSHDDAESPGQQKSPDDPSSSSSVTSEISGGNRPRVVVRSSGGARVSRDSNEVRRSGNVTDPEEDPIRDADVSETKAEASETGPEDVTRNSDQSGSHQLAAPTARGDNADPAVRGHADNPVTGAQTASVTPSRTTMIDSAGPSELPQQRSDQVAPPEATSTAVSESAPPAELPSSEPTPKVDAEMAAVGIVVLGALGGLGDNPEAPVGSPIFEALVAAYRRTEDQPWDEEATAATATTPTLLAATITVDDTQPATADAGEVDFAVTSDWGSGYVAKTTVTAGESDLQGWTLEFDSPDQITGIWSAEIVSHVGDHYVVQNAAWNATVAAGQVTTFGFQATSDGSAPSVTNFVLNGNTIDDEPAVQLPTLTISNATINEGNSGTTQLDLTVTLSAASATPVSVAYTTANGTATAGEDYAAASGTITFDPGQTTQQITIGILGDTTVETNETFTVTLTNPSAATIATATATTTITNDDTQPPSTGDGSVDFAVTSDWGSGYVAKTTVTAGESDLQGWTLEFDSPDQITGIWSAEIVSHVGDHYVVQNAAWNATVAAGQVTTFGFQATSDGSAPSVTNFVLNGNTIDDEPAVQLPTLTISNATINEGNSGTTQLDLTVTLSAASATPVSVAYTTANGTATAGEDYAAASGTITFDPGQTTQQITIGILGDTTVETNETFTVTLTNPSAATIATATTTITNDDAIVAQSGDAVFAPYVDMGAYPVPDLTAIATQYGVTTLNLGFMQADPDGNLAWAGLTLLEPDSEFFQAQQINESIAEFQAAGGQIVVSLGGVSGTTIAQTYAAQGLDAQALADAYEGVIETYSLDRIDFDVEGAAVADRVSVDLRNDALAIVQQDYPDLEIWYTLPVLPSGLTSDGVYVVQSALDAGVALDGVNVMTMDYGESAAPTTGPNAQTMGAYAIEAAESTYQQMSALYAGYGIEFSWSMIGVTPMIGVNDITTEVFTLDDAQAVLDFANSTGLGMISFWSITRDNPGTIGQATNYASGIDAPSGSFSDIFNDYGVDNATSTDTAVAA